MDFALNFRHGLSVIIRMKTTLCMGCAALLILLVGGCGPSAPLSASRADATRSGSGNADLEGPSADDVIRRSTHQWHADRWHERRRR